MKRPGLLIAVFAAALLGWVTLNSVATETAGSEGLQAGDALTLHARPNPDFPFTRLIQIVYHGKATKDEIRRMAELEGLASQWREHAKTLLD